VVRLRIGFARRAGLRLYDHHRPDRLRDNPDPVGSGPGVQGPGLVVEPGTLALEDILEWTVAAVARQDNAVCGIRWIGSHVHGRPGAEHLYLSWKAPDWAEGLPDPWIWRLKLPLQEVAALLEQAGSAPTFVADVSGRVTHDSSPVGWRLARPLET
jgi:hypothetical protein